jgi:hypothetical protein
MGLVFAISVGCVGDRGEWSLLVVTAAGHWLDTWLDGALRAGGYQLGYRRLMTARRLRGGLWFPPGHKVSVLPRKNAMNWLGQTYTSHPADLSSLIRLAQESVELRAWAQELAAELSAQRIRFRAEHTIFRRQAALIRESLHHLRLREGAVPLLPGWRYTADTLAPRPDIDETLDR